MNIYFCGSMTGSREKQANYEEVINYLKTYGNVLNEFVADKQVTDFNPRIVFERDYANMQKADIVIADITLPSTGVGFELGNFFHMNKKVLVLYDNNYPAPSSLPRGCNKFVVYPYNAISEELDIIKNFIQNTQEY